MTLSAMKIFSTVVLCLIFTASSFAQDKAAPDTKNAPDKKNAAISGIVVKEPGSQTLKKVTITLVAENQEEGGNYTVTTDSDGHFSIDNIRPGRYRMLLERTGYTEINERQHKFDGRTLSLSSGQQLKDLRLTMLMTATVLGRVVDEDGDPLPAVEVIALEHLFGKAQWEPSNSERTNDLGEYRISGLFPGHYYLSASPAPDFQRLTNMEASSPATGDQPALRRVPTYYPGTTDRSQAASLDLRPGDEIPVNFTMIPSRAYTVRGSVAALSPGNRATVMLMAREYGVAFNAAEVDKDGKFELRGVPSGSYFAIAFTDDDDGAFRTVRQRVDVVSGNVEDVRLAPATPGIVRGQVLADNPAVISHTYISLRSLDDDPETGFMNGELEARQARVNADGSFEIKNVNAGRYAVEFMSISENARNYFVRSVRLGSTAADTGFSVSGNAGPLSITLSSHSATIEGSVLDEHDKTLADCTVVAVPDEQFRKLRARFGKARADQNGRFLIRGLAPGSYTVYAWQDLDGEPYLDSQFLKSQEEFGKSVRAEADRKTAIDIKAAVPPAETR